MTDAADVIALARKSADSDLAFLLKAKEEAKSRLRTDPSPENINAFNKAKAAMETEMARQQNTESPAEVLGNILKVETYLAASGWKVKKSKLYKDKRAGLLKVQPDGAVLRADADAYAVLARLRPADAAPDAPDQKSLELRRQLEEAELEAKRQLVERNKLRLARELGEVVPREEVDRILVAAVSVLRSGMRQWIYGRMAELVELVRGDPSRVEPAIHMFLDESNAFFNGFARARNFDVVDDEDDAPPGAPGEDAA